jgi:phosphate-selective porin OprO/OprP
MARVSKAHPALVAPLFCLALPCVAAEGAAGWSFQPSATLQHDAARFHLDGESGDDDAPRRTRAALSGSHRSGLQFKFEWDFVGGTATDAYLKWPLGERGDLRFGQYKQPFSLEEQNSSRELPLLERSPAHDAFTLGRRAGLMWTTPLAGQQLQLSAFGASIEQPSDAQGLAARMFGAPEGIAGLHLGAALAWEQRRDEQLRLRARPGIRLLPSTPLDSGRSRDIDNSWRASVEAAWIRDGLTLQSELIALRGNGDTQVSGTGAYVQASWLSGGATRSIKSGSVRAPRLEPGQVRFEYSAQVSRVDFERSSHGYGDQSELRLAALAYIGPHVQLGLEQGWIDGADRTGADFDGRFSLVRLQLAF